MTKLTILLMLACCGQVYSGEFSIDTAGMRNAKISVPAAPVEAAASARQALYEPRHKKVDLSGLFPETPVSEVSRGRDVNLRDSFVDGDRQQGNVGSCHAFSAVALLEAAYATQYGRKIKLSEADLFLRRSVLGNSLALGYIMKGKKPPMLAEAASPIGDVEYGIKTGVSMGPDYNEFLAKYEKIDSFSAQNIRLAALLDLKQKLRAHFDLDDPEIARQRDELRRSFTGFKTRSRTYYWQTVSQFVLGTKPGPECRAKAAEVVSMIVRELDEGRPVGIGMYWGRPNIDNGHALVFAGYETKSAGGYSFLVRNSWGGTDSENIEDERLCRVVQIVSVVPPIQQKKHMHYGEGAISCLKFNP